MHKIGNDIIEQSLIVGDHQHRIVFVAEFVHAIGYNGRIVKSGTRELALELEERGYDFIKNEVEAV